MILIYVDLWPEPSNDHFRFSFFHSPIPLNGQEVVYRDGVIVGYQRNGEYAFTLDKSIGYGYVRHPEGKVVTSEWLKEGNYELERMGIKYKATYHSRSPFDPDNKRIKGIYE